MTTRFPIMLMCGLSCLASDPVVSNVRASQRGGGSKLVDIYYDVADSAGDRLTVAVAVTTNGVAIPATTFQSGSAVGAGVVPGSGKRIVWDAGADWSGKFSESVRVAITANDGRAPPAPSGMVLIPAGTNSGIDPDFGAYELTVEAFYMDATEVTKAKWDEVYTWAVAHGYTFDNAGSGKASNHPVHTVNWCDCVKWCNARSQKEERTPCYTVSGSVYKTGQSAQDCNFSANGYRLPTNAEWEYAARGGLSSKRFPWGDTIQHARANYSSSVSWAYDTSPTRGYHPTYATGVTPHTSPAGAFAANGYGLYDMAGNVWEWCNDTSSGSDRGFRGSGWIGNARGAQCGSIGWYNPVAASPNISGFRAVCR